MNQSKSQRVRLARSFTLIELLVVVAVIAILTGILLPSLQKAKERGKQAVCIGNLRQIYLAFANYAGDNDDKIPHVGTPYSYLYGTRGETWHHWLGKAHYIGSQDNNTSYGYFVGPVAGYDNTRWEVLRCPSEPGAPLVDVNYPRIKGTAYYDSEFNATSYVMNWSVSDYCYYLGYCPCYLGASCDPYPFRKGFSKGPEDGHPAEAPFVTDCPVMGLWGLPYFGWGGYDGIDIDAAWWTYWYYGFRHSGNTANMLYMDGHVEAVKHHKDSGKFNYKTLWAGPPPL